MGKKLSKAVREKLKARADEIIGELQVFSFQIAQTESDELDDLSQMLSELATEALNEVEMVLGE